MDAIVHWDVHLFRLINAGPHHPLLDGMMLFASSPWTWVALALWFVVAGVMRRNRRLLMSCISVGVAIGVVDMASYYLLKPAFARIRPCRQLADVRLVSGSCGGEYSLPSNHAANAAAVVASASIAQRAVLPGAMIVAALVGVSRVYLGVHYPIDIVFGWVFGALCGTLIQLLLERIFRKWIGKSSG